jgi:hypothetical protein
MRSGQPSGHEERAAATAADRNPFKHREPEAAYAAGLRAGVADRTTGALILVCGDLNDPATRQWCEGYRAARFAKQSQKAAAKEPDREAGS